MNTTATVIIISACVIGIIFCLIKIKHLSHNREQERQEELEYLFQQRAYGLISEEEYRKRINRY